MIKNGGGKIAWLVLGTVDPHTRVQIPPLTLFHFCIILHINKNEKLRVKRDDFSPPSHALGENRFLEGVFMENAVSFKNSKGQKLLGILHVPEKIKKVPAIVCCHGFARNKVDKFRIWIRIARALCNSGFVVLRFDFSGHGDSEGELEDISISQEIDDLKCAINYLKTIPETDKNKIGIIGHSLGGDIAILASVNNKSIKALVLLSPVVNYRNLHKDFLDALAEAQKSGIGELASHKIKWRYFDELKNLETLNEIHRVNVPLLLIHGTVDERVDIGGSKELFEKANEPKKLTIINTADHDFAGYDNTMRAIKETIEWFNRWLK